MRIWKDIPNYEGLYQVSNYGDVKNVRRNKILRQCKHRLGYMSVMLYKNKQPKRLMVHRLVAMTFLENCQSLECVNHKDENKSNNHVDNLEWCSREYNMQYGTLNARISKKRGHMARRKRKVVQINQHGNVVKTWESIAQASVETGTSRTSIYKCCNGLHKTANGFAWSYIERTHK